MRMSDWSSDVCSSDLLLDAGIPLALGSDGPANPWLNMMWARQLPAAPAQALTREQVLRAYTAGSAYAEFAEDTKGRPEPGYVADLAVLSPDVLDRQEGRRGGKGGGSRVRMRGAR